MDILSTSPGDIIKEVGYPCILGTIYFNTLKALSQVVENVMETVFVEVSS